MNKVPVPTIYANTQFRSRLEARWAAFFDLIGWRWTYEPFDAGGYIPDFLIHGNEPMFIEVGPCITGKEYFDKMTKPEATLQRLKHDLLIVGVDPIAPFNAWVGHEYPTAGWFGEYFPGCTYTAPPYNEPPAFGWAVGIWGWCDSHSQYSVWHEDQSYDHRPCGGPDREHPINSRGADGSAADLSQKWRQAGNLTQWRGPR